jgi:hypothetical protein
MSKKNAVVWLFAGLAISACSAASHSESKTRQARLAMTSQDGFHGHVMPTVERAAAAPETGVLSYYGGKVLPSVRIQAIYWGNSGSYQAQLDPFLQSVAGNGFLGWLGEYDTASQNVGGGSRAASFVDTTAPSGATVDDSQIRSELVSLIDAGSVPAPDTNTLYMFFFPSGVNVSLGGQGSSCSTFCGYHDTLVSGTTETYYAVLPDPATCGGSCDNQNGDYFEDLTSVTTHELTEAVTDPEVGIAIENSSDGGAYPTFPNAWAAGNGGSEIGDLCAWKQGTYGGYNVQLEWSDVANACVTPGAGGTEASRRRR